MASRVAQQDAKRQLSKGKKKGKTTTLIVTHEFPLFSHKSIYIHFQSKKHSTLLFESTMSVIKGAMYIQVVFESAETQAFFENVVANVVNDLNLCHLSFIYFAVSQAIDTVPTVVIKMDSSSLLIPFSSTHLVSCRTLYLS